MDTKENKSMAKDATKTEGAKTEANTPTPVVTPATVAPETVTITKSELSVMMQEAAREAADRVRNEFDEYLKRQPAASPAKETVVLQAKPHRDISEETDKALKIQGDALAEKNAALEAGPRQFQCSCASQPRQDRIVGAMDEVHAKAKYEAYYGITGAQEATARVKVEEITPAPAAA